MFYNSDNSSYSANNASFGNGVLKVGIGDNPIECWLSGSLGNATHTLDILGHEIAHGVVSSSGVLNDYEGEEGALNESFADIFGVMSETFAFGSLDFEIGEDRCSGPLRSLSDPNAHGDPDTYLGTNWAPTGVNDPDNGGVHTNSGVQNHWFYLLSAGGSGVNDNQTPYNISAIGLTKAANIAYRNLTVYMTNTSTYVDARAGAIQAAADLYGECSNEQLQTNNAWMAVGLGVGAWSENLTVSNNTSGFISNSFYATQTITSPANGSSATVNSYHTNFCAGGSIHLHPGFHATASGNVSFRGRIQSCSEFP